MTTTKPSPAIMQRLRANRRPRTKADFEWMPSGPAQDELARAFNLPSEVASMLLHGLVATGKVRALDRDSGELIDLDQCTIADLEGKLKSVTANELRDWLSEHSGLPQGSQSRDGVIEQMFLAGIDPPRTIPWKKFYDDVRDGCGGWIGNGAKRKPALGFGDKQIQRAVKALRQR